jgi:ABC-type amino acid transport substrate-binding protein
MIITVVLILLWLFVLAFTVLHYRNDRSYITRTRNWSRGQWKESIEAKKASLFDFSSFSAAVLSVLGLTVGWYTITQQNAKAALDQQSRDASEQITQHKHLLDQLQEARMSARDNAYIRLGLPGRDAKVIGNHVDISWDYPGHTPQTTYVVELITKDQGGPSGPEQAQCLDRFITAEESSDEQTQVRGTDKCPLNGKYLWRVAPRRSYDESDLPVGGYSALEWSEYGSFEIYPSIQERVLSTNVVQVGTTYTEDDTFSGRDRSGDPRGHDMDLIELLVRGCLKRIENDTLFDAGQCDANMQVYRKSTKGPKGHYRYQGQGPLLDINVVPYESVDEGLKALARREVDVFIGSVTKAKRRERGLIFFSRGYFAFHSGLYVRSSEGGVPAFDHWRGHKQNVGVISNSTNHWLGTQLTTEGGSDNRITLVAFKNFLGLEKAFEDGEIDGAVVDCMLASRLVDAVAMSDLEDTNAWAAYLKDPDNLGYGIEELGIAMVRDVSEAGVSEARTKHFSWWTTNDRIGNKVQVALQEALEHVVSKPEIASELRDRNLVSATIPKDCAMPLGVDP